MANYIPWNILRDSVYEITRQRNQVQRGAVTVLMTHSKGFKHKVLMALKTALGQALSQTMEKPSIRLLKTKGAYLFIPSPFPESLAYGFSYKLLLDSQARL